MIRDSLSLLAAGLLLRVAAMAQHSAIPCFDPDFGTNLNLGDDQTVAISLPFTFMFPGGPSNTISVCSNGFLWVGTNFTAPAVPSENAFLTQPARVAPLWVDLDPSSPMSGGVWARVTSSRAVITWNSVPISGIGSKVTMQVQLLPHGTIVCHYENLHEPYRTVLVGVHGRGNNPAAVDLSSVAATPIDTGVQPDAYEVFTSSAGNAGFDLRMRTLLFSPTCCGGYRVTERAQCHSLYFADRSASNSSVGHHPGFYDAGRGEIVLPTTYGERTLAWNGTCLRSAPFLSVTGGVNYISTNHGWQACQDPTRPGAGLFLMSFPPNLFFPQGLPPSLWRFEQGTWAQLAPPVLADVAPAAMAADTQRRVVVCHDSAGHRTFEFDGTSWTQIGTQNFPPQGAVRMAFDSLRGRMVLVHTYPGPGTWEYFNSDWHHVSATSPRLETMVYDASRGRIVTHGLNLLTWEWDGSAWMQVGQPPPPPATPFIGWSEQIVYDEHRRETVLIRTGMYVPPPGFQSDVWAWNGSTWTQRFARGVLAGPSQRSEAVASHDPGLDTVVVFGGHSALGQALNETWLWNGQSWRDRTGAAGSPGARSNAAMAWLPAGARGRPAMTVLHGGVGPQGSPLGDAWALDAAGTWQPLSTSGRTPPARHDHAMVATPGGELVLFGGSAGLAGFLGDTWKLDAMSQWVNTSPVTAPPARDMHAMAYDSLRGRAVLFGGRGQGGIGTVLADTWEYDPANNVWVEVTPASGSPTGRWNHSLVYDPRRARTVLFGGGNGVGGMLNDVWEWDGVRWIARGFDSLPPSAAWQMAATWDATNQRIFAFGGEAIQGTPQNATWEITAHEDRVTFDRENYQPLHVTSVPIVAPGHTSPLRAEFATPGGLGIAVLDFGPRAGPYVLMPPPLICVAPDWLYPAPLWIGVYVGARARVDVPLPYFPELASTTFWVQGLVAEGPCLRVTETRAVLCRP